MAPPLSDAQVMKAIRTDLAGAEHKLLENLQILEKKPQGYCAIHVHLSALQAANRRSDYVHIAERAFDLVTLAHNAEMFILGNYDIFLTAPVGKMGDIDTALGRVKTLFQADPLIQRQTDMGESAFVTWYDLEEDFSFFKEAVVSTALIAKRAVLKTGQSGIDVEKLTPKNLDQIARMFRKLDARPFMRNQSAIQILPNGKGRPLFREYYVSIQDLRRVVAPDYDLTADRWLFQYLTSLLDQRILHMVRSQSLDDLPRTISLNLNLQTLYTKDFQQFDQFVGGQSERILFEFQPVDVFNDVTLFDESRAMLQARGYKVLVDGLQILSLDYFDPSLLQADFYKLAWGDRLGATTTADGVAEMRDLIYSMGAEKVIMSHVDSEEAVRFGLQLGIQRFQGFFVDRLVDAMTQKAAALAKSAGGRDV